MPGPREPRLGIGGCRRIRLSRGVPWACPPSEPRRGLGAPTGRGAGLPPWWPRPGLGAVSAGPARAARRRSRRPPRGIAVVLATAMWHCRWFGLGPPGRYRRQPRVPPPQRHPWALTPEEPHPWNIQPPPPAGSMEHGYGSFPVSSGRGGNPGPAGPMRPGRPAAASQGPVWPGRARPAATHRQDRVDAPSTRNKPGQCSIPPGPRTPRNRPPQVRRPTPGAEGEDVTAGGRRMRSPLPCAPSPATATRPHSKEPHPWNIEPVRAVAATRHLGVQDAYGTRETAPIRNPPAKSRTHATGSRLDHRRVTSRWLGPPQDHIAVVIRAGAVHPGPFTVQILEFYSKS